MTKLGQKLFIVTIILTIVTYSPQVALCAPQSHQQMRDRTPVRLVVNFASPDGLRVSKVGLSTDSVLQMPSDRLLRALDLSVLRSGQWANSVRATANGASFDYQLSDGWGYPGDAQNPYSRGRWPYEDFTAWEDYVQGTVTSAHGKHIVWDVWRWPNAPAQWPGTRAQYCELLSRTWKVLQANIGPSASVVLPHFSTYDSAHIEEMVEYAEHLDANVAQVDWCETCTGSAEHRGTSHAAEFRRWFKHTFPKRHVPEIVLDYSVLDTPTSAQLLSELADAHSAQATALFDLYDKSGSSATKYFPFNSSHSGVVPLYWLLRSDAAGRNARVWCVSTSPQYLVSASARGELAHSCQVMVARLPSSSTASAQSFQIDLIGLDKLAPFRGHKKLLLTLQRVRSDMSNEQTSPRTIASVPLALSNGRVRTAISGLQPGEVFLIIVRPM